MRVRLHQLEIHNNAHHTFINNCINTKNTFRLIVHFHTDTYTVSLTKKIMYTSYTSKAQRSIPVESDASLQPNQPKKKKKTSTASNVHKKNPKTIVKSRSELIAKHTSSTELPSPNSNDQDSHAKEQETADSHVRTKDQDVDPAMTQTSTATSTNAVSLDDGALTQFTSSPSSGVAPNTGTATGSSTQDTLLPGYTSAHASMNPVYDDDTPISVIIEGMDNLKSP